MRRAAKALVKAGEIIHKLWIILSRDISEQMLYGGVQSRIALCSSIDNINTKMKKSVKVTKVLPEILNKYEIVFKLVLRTLVEL